jgi:toxin ParE1/3/4
MKLVFSPAAISDLQSIADYTLDTWGVDQEALYLKGLWTKLEEIRTRPEACRIRTDLAIGCRSARHGKHVIFFMEEEDCIQVIRILHGAMDFDGHLPDDLI